MIYSVLFRPSEMSYRCKSTQINGNFLVFCFLQDTFFYSLVYDPTQKTLLADKGEIRVGPRFQADVPEMLQEGQNCT